MKYDVFMMTRASGSEYKWFCKPDYMSADDCKSCQSIIDLCKQEVFSELSSEDWYSNFFYLQLKDCCLLARISRTKYNGPEKRKIVSFEGFAVKKKYEKRLFFNVPALISELMSSGRSLRTKLEEDGVAGDVFEFVPLIKLNPFNGTKIPDGINPILKGNDAYRNLLEYTAFTDKPAGYIFGKNARDFSGFIDMKTLGITHIFDFKKSDIAEVDAAAFSESYKPVTCDYEEPIPTGCDKISINLFVQETGKDTFKYRWEMKPWDNSVKGSNRARYVTKFFEIEEGIELAKLELQKEMLKKFLFDNNWQKQPAGLRFEKDTYQREGNT